MQSLIKYILEVKRLSYRFETEVIDPEINSIWIILEDGEKVYANAFPDLRNVQVEVYSEGNVEYLYHMLAKYNIPYDTNDELMHTIIIIPIEYFNIQGLENFYGGYN
jgi:hypothetical protein